jgi:hypothetical protein
VIGSACRASRAGQSSVLAEDNHTAVLVSRAAADTVVLHSMAELLCFSHTCKPKTGKNFLRFISQPHHHTQEDCPPQLASVDQPAPNNGRLLNALPLLICAVLTLKSCADPSEESLGGLRPQCSRWAREPLAQRWKSPPARCPDRSGLAILLMLDGGTRPSNQ